MRHAKSSWGSADLSDHERPLNGQGHKDAEIMAGVCARNLPAPDLLVVSSARRTRETAEYLQKAWKLRDSQIVTEDLLYHAGFAEWCAVCAACADKGEHVLCCAHQPGLGHFAGSLDANFFREVTTAAVISFFINEPWPQNGYSLPDAKLAFYGIPREYR